MPEEYATYDLSAFGLKEMIHSGRALRALNREQTCMETAASSVVDFFHDRFRSPAGTPNCVLARCFKTHRLGALPKAQRPLAAAPFLESTPGPDTQCLTLLATRGERAEWNSRHTSAGHQAIPLATVAMVARAPMIFQLILQLGLTPEDIVDPLSRSDEQTLQTFNVFHVLQAHGSAIVPDQKEFVERHGVASVLGFGGLLAAGELFAVILFTRVGISVETAALFRTLALSVKLHLLPFSGKRVFASEASGEDRSFQP